MIMSATMMHFFKSVIGPQNFWIFLRQPGRSSATRGCEDDIATHGMNLIENLV